jgi:hypothetical protein
MLEGLIFTIRGKQVYMKNIKQEDYMIRYTLKMIILDTIKEGTNLRKEYYYGSPFH